MNPATTQRPDGNEPRDNASDAGPAHKGRPADAQAQTPGAGPAESGAARTESTAEAAMKQQSKTDHERGGR